MSVNTPKRQKGTEGARGAPTRLFKFSAIFETISQICEQWEDRGRHLLRKWTDRWGLLRSPLSGHPTLLPKSRVIKLFAVVEESETGSMASMKFVARIHAGGARRDVAFHRQFSCMPCEKTSDAEIVAIENAVPSVCSETVE